MKTKPQVLTLALLAGILLFAGCGGKKHVPSGILTGTVVDKNGPVGDLQLVIYAPADLFTSGGIVSADGTFKVEEVPVGSYEAWLTPLASNDDDDMDEVENSPKPKIKNSVIPSKYSDGKTSGLKFTVTEGNESTLDIDMSK